MCMSIIAYISVYHKHADACRSQEKALDPLELELQFAIKVLESEPRSSSRVISAHLSSSVALTWNPRTLFP